VLFSGLEQGALRVQHLQETEFPLAIAFAGSVKRPLGAGEHLIAQHRRPSEGCGERGVLVPEGGLRSYGRCPPLLCALSQLVAGFQHPTLIPVKEGEREG